MGGGMSIETLHPGPTSGDVIRDIFAIHRPQGGITLDLTYGAGVFWKWDYRAAGVELLTNDINPAIDADTWIDFIDAADILAPVDVVVFDPPFTANGPSALRHQDRYGAHRDSIGGKKPADWPRLRSSSKRRT